MAWYSKATRRTVAWANAITRKKGYTRPEVVVLHIAVSQRTSKSLYGFFTGSGRGVVCSHFHVADDGTVEQYIDTARRSSADYSGGDRTISIETAGGLGADLNKGWSPEARESIAQVLAWAHKTHGIPLRLMSSSRKTEKGIGYHRLGVPATRTQKLLGRSQTGGELWSGAVGKVCPGAARQAQVPGIVARAVEIAGGKPAPAPGGTSKPSPAPSKPASGKVGGEWPGSPLLVDGDYGPVTRRAYQRLLAGIKRYTGRVDAVMGPLTVKAEQRWLKGLGYYKGRIDGQRGPLTIKALQAFLRAKKLYTGRVDGDHGPLTTKALQTYLNQQAKFFKK